MSMDGRPVPRLAAKWSGIMATAYNISMKDQPTFILLNGPMGSGKSTVAHLLGKKLRRTAVIEIEDVRRLVLKEDNLLAWKIIYRMCDEYLRNHVSVLLQQTVASREMANRFLRLAKKHRCIIRFYHLRAPRGVLLERIRTRESANSVSRAHALRNIKKQEKMKFAGATIINTAGTKPVEVVQFVLNDLEVKGGRIPKR